MMRRRRIFSQGILLSSNRAGFLSLELRIALCPARKMTGCSRLLRPLTTLRSRIACESRWLNRLAKRKGPVTRQDVLCRTARTLDSA